MGGLLFVGFVVCLMVGVCFVLVWFCLLIGLGRGLGLLVGVVFVLVV